MLCILIWLHGLVETPCVLLKDRVPFVQLGTRDVSSAWSQVLYAVRYSMRQSHQLLLSDPNRFRRQRFHSLVCCWASLKCRREIYRFCLALVVWVEHSLSWLFTCTFSAKNELCFLSTTTASFVYVPLKNLSVSSDKFGERKSSSWLPATLLSHHSCISI